MNNPPQQGIKTADLPEVGGRRLDCTNAFFEHRCRVYLGREQQKLNADNGLIALLCDAVRCVREYNDAMNGMRLASIEQENQRLREALVAIAREIEPHFEDDADDIGPNKAMTLFMWAKQALATDTKGGG